ncbi:MAG: hypothetical protein KC466_00960, partial [Myxococcales bacterium]|nr:hypothetical protein [Myxococcales bacterium]
RGTAGMPSFTINREAHVLVELSPVPGGPDVVLAPEDFASRSREALDSAMDVIHHMARRARAMIEHLPEPPTLVELDFGLRLDVDGDALVARSAQGATIGVKLVWRGENLRGNG